MSGGGHGKLCPPFYKHLSEPLPDISEHESMQLLRLFAGLSVFYDIFYHTSGEFSTEKWRFNKNTSTYKE